MTATVAQLDEPTYPHPPRYWWLKRIVVLTLVLIAAYAGILSWWRSTAERRMAAEIARLQQAGERVTVEDFQPVPIDEDLNAAATYRKAAAALSARHKAVFAQLRFFPEIDPRLASQLEQISGVSMQSRSLARRARFQPEFDWGYVIRSPVINVMLPNLNPQRHLTSRLSANVVYEHFRGSDAEAIELVRDMLSQSDRLHEGSPMLVAHLVGIGMTRLTASTIRAIAHDLDVLNDRHATTTPLGSASREQVQALIAELTDERRYRVGFVHAMQGERLVQHDTAANPQGPFVAALPTVAALRPMYRLDALRMMRQTTQLQDAGRAENYPAAQKAMPNVARPWSVPRSAFTHFSRIYSQFLTAALAPAVHSHFVGLTERRVAAVRLAMRLYQLDHQDDYPATLDQLVPAYLPALPADPFRGDGKTFGYIQPVTGRPLLYSVGPDGIDGGGDTTLPANLAARPNQGTAGEPDDRFADDRADWIYPLGKPPPPATQPIDEDSE